MRRTSDSVPPRGDASGSDASTSSILPSWLLMAKVMAPAPPVGYVHRTSLLKRIDAVLDRRLTVLQAPGGFGKTTVLADVSHRKKKAGLVVAWLSLDQDDSPDVFGNYLALAFEHAGLDLAALNDEKGWLSYPYTRQVGMLAREIQLHADPCLLVLDELERLPTATVELVDFLLRHAPPNLHFAMAFRFNPGLDLAAHFLAGTAIIANARQFRFSRPNIAQFFDGALSRRELAAVEERTAGWPVALIVDRNTRTTGAEPPRVDAAGLSENYVGVRLLRGLSKWDRALLCDLSVFDWIDADLVDEVLGSSDARLRVTTLPCLDGLLLPVGRDGTVSRLHPLVREYCARRLAVDDPGRKRLLHARIARALHQRGHLRPAWRHGTLAGDSQLVGQLIEDVGVLGLWLREGTKGLTSAGQFLTSGNTARYPRLALLRCVYLQLASKFHDAVTLYETVSKGTAGFTKDREGGDAEALTVDRVFTQAVLAGGTCRSLHDALDPLLPADGVSKDIGQRARFVSSAWHLLRCVSCCQRARFAESHRHGLQAQSYFAEGMRHGDVITSIYLGMAAMVQGRVQDAVDSYKRARHSGKDYFSSDPRLATSIDILSIELDLERNRGKAIQQRTLQGFTELRGVWNEIYAVAVAVRAELAFEQYDSQAVIQFLSRTIADVRMFGRSLETYAYALLVLYLARAGRGAEAGQIWVDHALPCGNAELLDLDGQSWRRMEALSCARVLLLAEQNEFEAASELVDALCATASQHGMTRTVLRGLSLSIAVAHRAGQEDRALSRLVEFLRLTRDVDYVRPLVNQGGVGRTLLRRLLETNLDADLQSAAEATLSHFGVPRATGAWEFTPREMDVLVEVRHGRRNLEIASALGITDGGVRYHLKNIYRKTGVSRRLDAVRYAENKGVLF